MANLPTRTLGRTGLEVTTLGYGAMELRGGSRGPGLSDEQADQVLNAVLDAGINLIDTSPDYGLSEERIGRYIAHRRDEFVLTSKCGCLVAVEPTPDGPRHVFTPENIRAGVEQSLERMNTDYIDVVQFHGSPSRAELEEHGAVEALQRLQQEGKVRYLGMSGTTPHLADQIAMGVFDAFQIPYSLLQREHGPLIDAAAEAGAGTLIRGGAARGTPSDDKAWTRDRAAMRPGFVDPFADAESRWAAANLDELAGEMGRMAFTLRFTLTHPGLSTTIVGTSNPAHLAANVAVAAAGPLPDDVYSEAIRRLEATDPLPA